MHHQRTPQTQTQTRVRAKPHGGRRTFTSGSCHCAKNLYPSMRSLSSNDADAPMIGTMDGNGRLAYRAITSRAKYLNAQATHLLNRVSTPSRCGSYRRLIDLCAPAKFPLQQTNPAQPAAWRQQLTQCTAPGAARLRSHVPCGSLRHTDDPTAVVIHEHCRTRWQSVLPLSN